MATIRNAKGKIISTKAVIPKSSKKTTVPAPVNDPFSKENLDKIGAARGNEFAPAFEAGGGVQKGESITETLDRRAGQSGGKGAAARAAKLAAEQKRIATTAAKARKEKRTKMGNTSYADKLRAGAQDTTKKDAITEKGSRSTPSVAKPLGTGTPLTDQEILDLEAQGFTEGDFIPGRGILLPDGTFNATGLTAQNMRNNEATVADKIVSSDEPIVRQEDAAKSKIETASITSPTKDALTLLDEELGRIKDDLRAREASIKSSYSTAKTGLEGTQANEMGQASVGLAEAGGYLGFSGGAQGVLLSLAQTHRTELADLDAKRQSAIQAARDAAADKRYDIVRDKADEIARIDQETYDRQEAYNERVRKETEKETAKQEKLQVQKDINDVIQYMRSNGSKSFSPEDIFNELNGTVDIGEINDFLEGITSKGSGIYKPTPTNVAAMLGSGMSSDDISSFMEYVNENGYDEKIRSSLEPAQRVAIDKFMRPKTGGGSVTGINEPAVSFEEYVEMAQQEAQQTFDPSSSFYQELRDQWEADFPTTSNVKLTSTQLLKLEQAGLLGASRQEQLDYLYSDDEEEDDLSSPDSWGS